MRTMKRVGLVAALLAALAVGGGLLAAPEEKKAKTDKDRLQGAWVAVSGEREGEAMNEYQLKNWEEMIFTDDKFTREGAEKKEGSFTLDPDQTPKEIDLTVNGKTWVGIYELKGTALKLALKFKPTERPTAFDSKGGILVVFKKKA
jgi:uncharacterized protein (TIGR03067 family)